MPDEEVCLCGHSEDEHNLDLGFCSRCQCVQFHTAEDMAEDTESEFNFDHEEDD